MQYELNLSRFMQYEFDLTFAPAQCPPDDAKANPSPAEPTYAAPVPASCRPG